MATATNRAITRSVETKLESGGMVETVVIFSVISLAKPAMA